MIFGRVRDRKKAFIDKRATLQSAILDFHPLRGGMETAFLAPPTPRKPSNPDNAVADAHVS